MTLRATCSAPSKGTPFLSNVPSVRDRRAVSSLRTSSPAMRMRSRRSSMARRLSGSASLRRNQAMKKTSPASISHQKCCRVEPTPTTMRVSSGSSTSMSANICSNCGTTTTSRTNSETEHHADQEGRIDQGIDHARLERARALEIVGQTAQRVFERTAGFAGAHHVDVEARKRAALRFERIGQGRAAANEVAHALEQVSRLFALRQIEQDLQGAIERLAGTEQGRQLLGELDDLRLVQGRPLHQRREQTSRIDAVGIAHVERNIAGVLQLADDLVVRGHVHLALEGLAGRRDGLVVVEGHGMVSRDSGSRFGIRFCAGIRDD